MKFSSLLSLAVASLSLMTSCSDIKSPLPADSHSFASLAVDSLGIAVAADAPREYSFTDKKSAFWYGMTHSNDWDNWYAGWNIAKRRLLSDYTLSVDGVDLDRSSSQVVVYPYKIERTFDRAKEQFYMLDDIELLYISLSDIQGDSVAISLSPRLISEGKATERGVQFVPHENPDGVISLFPFRDVPFHWDGSRLSAAKEAEGFILSFSRGESADSLALAFRQNRDKLLQERITRMNDLVRCQNPMSSDCDSLNRALSWLLLTTDQLITRQQGNGIYAGLPWFNEYWGRDMFISMPGAVLCTGQWQTARSILSDFAKFQDTDHASETLGRIPNRANLEGIIYNTADGTPRFVANIYGYLCYTGDTEYLASIYEAVKLSVDAALDKQTDADCFLLHADADTWMDAKRQGLYPCSPRGNRANDIQALWYQQLRCAAAMAEIMNEADDASRWNAAADKVAKAFADKFVDHRTATIFDHLNADSTPDRQFRPNQLYTFELVPDREIRLRAIHDIWSRLVYPWGVASLDQSDPQFHPYHENWHHYHKDDAYHNGTVWLWNNGMAMQRLIEFGQQDIAWQLFTNMNRQALAEGAVGSLSENADAWPLPQADWARRSGTFLQAWSNAEQIRIWYQGFLGINPQMLTETIHITPRIPSALNSLQYSQMIGSGHLEGAFRRDDSRRVYAYRAVNISARLQFDVETYQSFSVDVTPSSVVQLVACDDHLDLTMLNDKGETLLSQSYPVDQAKADALKADTQYFSDLKFAVPTMATDLPSLSRYFDPPLDYSSIE